MHGCHVNSRERKSQRTHREFRAHTLNTAERAQEAKTQDTHKVGKIERRAGNFKIHHKIPYRGYVPPTAAYWKQGSAGTSYRNIGIKRLVARLMREIGAKYSTIESCRDIQHRYVIHPSICLLTKTLPAGVQYHE